MVPSGLRPRRTSDDLTPMAGISSRTGADRGRRRQDPTGKLRTSVVRVGWAPEVLVAAATADRPAGGAVCDTCSPAGRPPVQPAAAATTTLSTTTPRRTLAPLVMTPANASAGGTPLLDHEPGDRGQPAGGQQQQGEPAPAVAGAGSSPAGPGGDPTGGRHGGGGVADVEQLELLADAAHRDQRRDGAAGQLQVAGLGQDLAAAGLADLDVHRPGRDLLVLAGRWEPRPRDQLVAPADQVDGGLAGDGLDEPDLALAAARTGHVIGQQGRLDGGELPEHGHGVGLAALQGDGGGNHRGRAGRLAGLAHLDLELARLDLEVVRDGLDRHALELEPAVDLDDVDVTLEQAGGEVGHPDQRLVPGLGARGDPGNSE